MEALRQRGVRFLGLIIYGSIGMSLDGPSSVGWHVQGSQQLKTDSEAGECLLIDACVLCSDF